MKAPVYTLQFRPPEKLAALQHFRPETSKVLKRGRLVVGVYVCSGTGQIVTRV
jgi:hypothetical protein